MPRPDLTCCTAVLAKFPSVGLAWSHATNCSVSPGQKVRTKARTTAEQKSMDVHPAGKGSGW